MSSDNVIEFKRRELPPVEPMVIEKGAIDPALFENMKPGPIVVVRESPSVLDLRKVVAALRFYAKSGFDHGEKAREALLALVPQGTPA